MRKKGRTRFVLAFDKRLTDEDVAGRGVVMRGKLHAPILIDGQTIERAALEGQHFGAGLFPVRLAPALFDKVRGSPLDPLGLDVGDTTGKEAAGFHEFGRHEPFAGLFGQGRARPHPKADAAGAQVRGGPQVRREIPHPEVPQKAR